MNLRPVDTNVVLFFGNETVRHFPGLVNQWIKMLVADEWDNLRFVLVSDNQPDVSKVDDLVRRYLAASATFYSFDKEVPDGNEFGSWLRTSGGTVKIHIICADSETASAYEWLKNFLREVSRISYLTVSILYYVLLSKASPSGNREILAGLLQEGEDKVFLLGEVDEKGGYVPDEERWQAIALAVLLIAAEQVSVKTQANSLGYSALNADGSELDKLCQSTVCQSLMRQLDPDGHGISEVEAVRLLLPEGVESTAGLRDWLQQKAMQWAKKLNADEWHNAWITSSMSTELESAEALKRMKQFIDLNYAESRNVEEAKTAAFTICEGVKERLRRNILTSCFPAQTAGEVINAFRQIAEQNPSVMSVTYDKQGFRLPFLKKSEAQKAAELDGCKRKIQNSIQNYLYAKNVCLYAGAMADAYGELARWIRRITDPDDEHAVRRTARMLLRERIRSLENASRSSTGQLRLKYRNFSEKLENLNPSVENIADGMDSVVFFEENGRPVEEAWQKLINRGSQNIRKKIPGYQHGFFSSLKAEFTEDSARSAFFDEYLKNGTRMYYSLAAPQTTGFSALLADERLSEGWFREEGRALYDVSTDNAENLTIYPLGNTSAADYLKNDRIHFAGSSKGRQEFVGSGLFDSGDSRTVSAVSSPRRPEIPRTGNSLFGGEEELASVPAAEKDLHGLKLAPDIHDRYQLSWQWNGNDKTATVRVTQDGVLVGKASCIGVGTFKNNGDAMDFTKFVMEERPVPMGKLVITVQDEKGQIYIDHAEVQGRCALVRFKMAGDRLQILMSNNQYAESIVLRSISFDGHYTYYPLYRNLEGKYIYSGLKLNDAVIAKAPGHENDPIYIVSAE